jgi:hypothetical protein
MLASRRANSQFDREKHATTNELSYIFRAKRSSDGLTTELLGSDRRQLRISGICQRACHPRVDPRRATVALIRLATVSITAPSFFRRRYAGWYLLNDAVGRLGCATRWTYWPLGAPESMKRAAGNRESSAPSYFGPVKKMKACGTIIFTSRGRTHKLSATRIPKCDLE